MKIMVFVQHFSKAKSHIATFNVKDETQEVRFESSKYILLTI